MTGHIEACLRRDVLLAVFVLDRMTGCTDAEDTLRDSGHAVCMLHARQHRLPVLDCVHLVHDTRAALRPCDEPVQGVPCKMKTQRVVLNMHSVCISRTRGG